MARDAALGCVEDSHLRSLTDILPVLGALDAQQVELCTSFAKIRGIPSNMRIAASRLEPTGGPISAISQNYRLMFDEAISHLGGLQGGEDSQSLPAQVTQVVLKGLFMMAASRLQGEVAKFAAKALVAGDEKDGFQYEVDILKRLHDEYSTESGAALLSVFNDVMELVRSAKILCQLVKGLDSFRVMCRVEAGRLGGQSVALTPVINQLDKFHSEIDSTLEQILTLADKGADLVDMAIPRGFNRSLGGRSTAERNLSRVYV
jgi:aerotaxis receptor